MESRDFVGQKGRLKKTSMVFLGAVPQKKTKIWSFIFNIFCFVLCFVLFHINRFYKLMKFLMILERLSRSVWDWSFQACANAFLRWGLRDDCVWYEVSDAYLWQLYHMKLRSIGFRGNGCRVRTPSPWSAHAWTI